MSARTLVLASASTARLRLLRAAGFDPAVVVSGVDEDDVDPADTAGSVTRIAAAKATAVADSAGRSLVIGCDSMLEFEGRPHGKPASVNQARSWLESMRGRSGTLHTGHCLIDELGGTQATAVASTTVHFATTTDAELDAYLATAEALEVAGAFTLDGRSAPFIDGIEGDPSNVIGLSLPLFRNLLSRLGHSVTDLWATSAP
jgi:septum formation protein